MRSTLHKFLPFLLLFAAAVGSAAEPPTAAPSRGIEYDRNAPFAVETRSREAKGNATVHDLTFFTVPGAKFGRVAAYLVEPQAAPRAAVLWVHWLGEPATTNRGQFISEAVALADDGVVSLLIDAMWAKPNWYRDRVLDEDFEDGVGQVGAILRAIDLLQQQPGAASVPLGIVGHDYGGMYAIVAAAQAARAKACVFIACTASLRDWAFFLKKPESMDAYLAENAPLDLRANLAAISGASFLFQFAEHDKYVPLARAQELFAAAPTPKQMIIYGGADHEMARPASIRADRTAWLKRELNLP